MCLGQSNRYLPQRRGVSNVGAPEPVPTAELVDDSGSESLTVIGESRDHALDSETFGGTRERT
jgi:hypothetical protein